MTLRAVILDVGGVLVHVEDVSGHQKWESRLSLEDGGLVKAVYWSEVSARASAGAATEAEVWEQVATPFSLSAAEVDELRQDFAAGERFDATWVPLLRALRPRYKRGPTSNGTVLYAKGDFAREIRSRPGITRVSAHVGVCTSRTATPSALSKQLLQADRAPYRFR